MSRDVELITILEDLRGYRDGAKMIIEEKLVWAARIFFIVMLIIAFA